MHLRPPMLNTTHVFETQTPLGPTAKFRGGMILNVNRINSKSQNKPGGVPPRRPHSVPPFQEHLVYHLPAIIGRATSATPSWLSPL